MLGHIEIGYVASTASRAVRIRIGAQVLARTSHGPAGSTSEAYGLKWFAAAKDAGFLDVALRCARDCAAEPATLVRAARDFAAKEPKFAAQIDPSHTGLRKVSSSSPAMGTFCIVNHLGGQRMAKLDGKIAIVTGAARGLATREHPGRQHH